MSTLEEPVKLVESDEYQLILSGPGVATLITNATIRIVRAPLPVSNDHAGHPLLSNEKQIVNETQENVYGKVLQSSKYPVEFVVTEGI